MFRMLLRKGLRAAGRLPPRSLVVPGALLYQINVVGGFSTTSSAAAAAPSPGAAPVELFPTSLITLTEADLASSSRRVASHPSVSSYPANDPIEDRALLVPIRIPVRVVKSPSPTGVFSCPGSTPAAPSVTAGRAGDTLVLAAVMDGHGGWQASDFVMRHLAATVEAELAHNADNTDPKQLGDALSRAFERLDREFIARVRPAFEIGFGDVARVGCCTLAALITPSHVIVANAGDCRAVFGSAVKAAPAPTESAAAEALGLPSSISGNRRGVGKSSSPPGVHSQQQQQQHASLPLLEPPEFDEEGEDADERRMNRELAELAEKRRREAAGGFSHQPFPSPSSSLNASSTRNASSGGGTVANGWGGLDGFERPFFMRVIETLTMLAPALAERRAAALAEAGVAPSSSPSSSSYGLSSAAGSFRGNNGYGRGLGLGDTGADGEAAALVTAFSSSYSNSNSVGAHGGAPPKQRIPPLEVAAQALSNDHNARVKAEQQQLRMAHPGEEDVVYEKPGSGAWYVKARLQPTRAIGDAYLKHSEFNGPPGQRLRGRHIPAPYSPPYITSKPEVRAYTIGQGPASSSSSSASSATQQQLTSGVPGASSTEALVAPLPSTSSGSGAASSASDSFLILACDGVWDVMTNAEAARFVAEDAGDPSTVADRLVSRALAIEAHASAMEMSALQAIPPGRRRRALHDDLTAIVLRLGRSAPLHAAPGSTGGSAQGGEGGRPGGLFQTAQDFLFGRSSPSPR